MRLRSADQRVLGRRSSPFAYAADGARVFVISSELELFTVGEIERLAAPIAAQGSDRIVLDLTAVGFIANRELAALAGMLRRLLSTDASIAVVGADPRAGRILAEINVDGLVFARTVSLALTADDRAQLADDARSSRRPSSPAVARGSEPQLPDRSQNRAIGT